MARNHERQTRTGPVYCLDKVAHSGCRHAPRRHGTRIAAKVELLSRVLWHANNVISAQAMRNDSTLLSRRSSIWGQHMLRLPRASVTSRSGYSNADTSEGASPVSFNNSPSEHRSVEQRLLKVFVFIAVQIEFYESSQCWSTHTDGAPVGGWPKQRSCTARA